MMKKIILAILIVGMLSGCSFQKFYTSDREPTISSHSGTSHFIFWGLGQTKKMNPEEVCGVDKVAGVETGYTFLNGLFGSLTWGIYQPMSYEIYCQK